jgi:hypothetical protein
LVSTDWSAFEINPWFQMQTNQKLWSITIS